MSNLERFRADTAGVENAAFLMNSGSSLPPRGMVDVMVDHLRLEEQIGGYAAANRENDRVESAYAAVARLLNASPPEIALHLNATVSWQMAFYALPFSPGDRILTSIAEYAANYVAYLQVANRTGAVIEVIPNDPFGATDVEALEAMIDERVKLISVTWVPTNGGLANPVAEIGVVARKHGITYFIDACQAVGQMVVDVEELKCDVLTATGRKFLRGPRGIGFLYIRNSLMQRIEPPVIDHYAAPWVARDRYQLRDDARRFETWEKSYAGVLGLGYAADYALDIGLDVIEERCRLLSNRLREGLVAIDGVQLLDLGRRKAAIVSFQVAGWSARDFVDHAERRSVVIGISAPASTRIDAEMRGLDELVRASPHYYNSEADIDRLIDLCRESVRMQRA